MEKQKFKIIAKKKEKMKKFQKTTLESLILHIVKGFLQF